MRSRDCFVLVIVSAATLLAWAPADAQKRGWAFGAGRPMLMQPGANNRLSTGAPVRTGPSSNAHPDFAWSPTGRPTESRFDGRYYIKGTTHRYSKGRRSIDGLKIERDVIERSGGDADLRVRVGAPPTITRTRKPGFR